MNDVPNVPEKSLKDHLAHIRARIVRANERIDHREPDAAPQEVTLVAVSKTFGIEAIEPLIEQGQRVFGENRVQEAYEKWPELRTRYSDIELHLIGPLQTNKAKEAVALFDVIETVDREKLAAFLSKEMKLQNKPLPCFVQVNIGNEPQKAGIAPEETEAFVAKCRQQYGLNIVGLMCIPPVDQAPGPYFAQLALLSKRVDVSHLSMGMSADFETAILMGATHVRVGSALFGGR